MAAIHIFSKHLAEALKHVKGALPGRSLVPIQSSVLITTSTATAIGIDCGIRIPVEATGGDGICVNPGEVLPLLDLINETVTLDTGKMIWSSGSANIETSPERDYPKFNTEKGTSITVNPGVLREGIKTLLPMLDTVDYSSSPFRNVWLDWENGFMYGGTGYACGRVALHTNVKGIAATAIPREACPRISAWLSGEDDVLMFETKNRLFFQGSALEMFFVKPDSSMPAFGQIFAGAMATEGMQGLQQSTGLLRQYLRAMTAGMESSMAILAPDADGYILTVKDILHNKQVRQRFDGSIPCQIAFSAELLLKSLSEAADTIEFAAMNKPAIVSNEDRSTIILVMPTWDK